MSNEKRVLEQAIDHWNAGDRDAWATLYAEDVVYEAPGGRGFRAGRPGRGGLRRATPAAPDRPSRDVVLFADGEFVVEQARSVGTHTGPLRSPDGVEVPPTGKPFDFPFVGNFRVQDDKIRAIRIYYDRIEVFARLGLMPRNLVYLATAPRQEQGRRRVDRGTRPASAFGNVPRRLRRTMACAPLLSLSEGSARLRRERRGLHEVASISTRCRS